MDEEKTIEQIDMIIKECYPDVPVMLTWHVYDKLLSIYAAIVVTKKVNKQLENALQKIASLKGIQ